MNTIEQQLFSWENCQAADPEQLQFSDVTLKVPIGEFKVGEKFDHATLLWEFSKLQLTRFGEGGRSERWDYELLLGAGQLLTRVSDPFGNPNQPKKIGAENPQL